MGLKTKIVSNPITGSFGRIQHEEYRPHIKFAFEYTFTLSLWWGME
jgi:hypothetical protein